SENATISGKSERLLFASSSPRGEQGLSKGVEAEEGADWRIGRIARVPPPGTHAMIRSLSAHRLHEHLLTASSPRAARPPDRHGDLRQAVWRHRGAGLGHRPRPGDPGLRRVGSRARGKSRINAGRTVVVAPVLELFELLPRVRGRLRLAAADDDV